MKVIGVSGKIGTGKDYITKNVLIPLFSRRENYAVLSFADPFKVEAIVRDKIDRKRVYEEKDEESRKKLQLRGTEEGRNVYGENIWVDTLYQYLLNYQERGIEYFFIVDVRFPNEIDFVRNQCKGHVFRVVAPKRNLKKVHQEAKGDEKKMHQIMTHVSETCLDNYNWPYGSIINNDPEDAINVVDELRYHITSIKYSWRRSLNTAIFVNLNDIICNTSEVYAKYESNALDYIRGCVAASTVVDPSAIPKYTLGIQSSFKNAMAEFAQTLGLTTNARNELANDICSGVDEAKSYTEIPDTIARLRQAQEDGHLVVVYTTGNFEMEMSKMIQLGISDIPLECIYHKSKETYASLLEKYPAWYTIFVDNKDVLIPSEAGADKTIMIDAKTSRDFLTFNK